MKSYFDGTVGSLVWQRFVAGFLAAITLGIGTPYALCRLYRWEMSHTVIDGNRLYFTGKAGDVFWQWIKWMLLTYITFGIYGFWLALHWKQWVVEHTHRQPSEEAFSG